MHEKKFDYKREADRLLSHRSVRLIGVFHKFLGIKKAMSLFHPEYLTAMSEVAILQLLNKYVIGNSLNISFARMKELVTEGKPPRSEAEASVMRYARALTLINEGHFTHKDMLSDIITLNNVLVYDTLESDRCQWRFHDRPSFQYPSEEGYLLKIPPANSIKSLVSAMCVDYTAVIQSGEIDPLLIIPVFVMDMQIIQPFDRGGVEMYRLITYYLMHWAGYNISETITVDHYISRNKLEDCHIYPAVLEGWEEGTNNYHAAFVHWKEGLRESCEQFEQWLEFLSAPFSNADLVLIVIKLYKEKIRKRIIMSYLPNIGEASIELALNTLKKQGLIKMISGGRYAEYVYVGPRK